MWISKAAWDEMAQSLALERARNRVLDDRCTRLTEAIIKKDALVAIKLPSAPMVAAPDVPVFQQPSPVEAPNQWAKDWFPSPAIATVPKPAPKVNSD